MMIKTIMVVMMTIMIVIIMMMIVIVIILVHSENFINDFKVDYWLAYMAIIIIKTTE